ncbi:MAG: hypothetical protein LBV33_00755, partial [Lachnospiraceae bacterium]|nr:hypothetical protein [Lachnospiraceae bacterium]
SKNEPIPAYLFFRPIEGINRRWGGIIKQFQIVQKQTDRFVLLMVVKADYLGWAKMLGAEYLEQLKIPSLNDAQWTFETVDRLMPDRVTGKLVFFHCEV